MARLIRTARPTLLLILACVPAAAGDEPPRRGSVAAAVETTLATRDDRIRQLAFDGDRGTSFACANPPGPRDHFTLVLDEPVSLKWAAAVAGRPGGGDAIRSGTLEVSTVGATFRPLARFAVE
jgi:hypothetical protein